MTMINLLGTQALDISGLTGATVSSGVVSLNVNASGVTGSTGPTGSTGLTGSIGSTGAIGATGVFPSTLTETSASGTPSAGTEAIWVDSTDHRFHDKNSTPTIG